MSLKEETGVNVISTSFGFDSLRGICFHCVLLTCSFNGNYFGDDGVVAIAAAVGTMPCLEALKSRRVLNDLAVPFSFDS